MRFMTFALLILVSSKLAAAGNDIEVLVTGLKNNNGKVILALHDNSDSFPTKPGDAIKTLKGRIQNGQSSVTFKNVPDGSYAIAVYHDENNNNKLDSNFLGIPKEGVGASNDAKGSFGPPKFADAMFTFSGLVRLSISVNY